MNKKGDLPYWMVMLIWLLIGLAVVLGIIGLMRGKFVDFLGWLG